MRQVQRLLNSTKKHLFNRYICQIMTLLAAIPMFLISNVAFAEAAPVCPSGHAMYYLGAKNLGTTPEDKLTLSWSGNTSNYSTTYTFKNNTTIKLSFSDINYLRDGYPEASIFAGVTTNAINMRHSSQQIAINHRLTALINKPVSKYGFVVQDLDSNASGRYTESMSIVTAGGSFSNYNTNFTLTNLNKTITGNQWPNCNPSSPCNFNIEWEAKSANTPFVATHGNPYSGASTTTSTGDHAVGYSDFYFCLAPPKLIVKKALNGTRVGTDDEFEISTTEVSTTEDGKTTLLNQFTTTGNGTTLGNSSSSVQNLKENTTYIISERVTNGGNITNYNATYSCLNSTTGSKFTSLDGSSSSFKISGLSYGDEITCTITNTSIYTFSGTVFDDNGGITAADSTKQNITSTFTANSAYFNGILDSNESGIFDSALQVTLTNCDGTKVVTSSANPQTVSSSGKYSFTVQPSALPTRICIVETEPKSWVYSVDTTANTREVSINNGTYIYNNLDFGEVKANNASLVLIKSQYVHNCNINTNFNGTTGTPSQTPAFSIAEIKDIEPRKCIAYRIEAYNRGHVDLKDIQINDQLQVKSQTNLVTSVFALPVPKGDPTSLYTGTTLPTGTITSELFNLNKPTGSTPTKATLYFNTKYGTTMDTQ